MNKIFAYGSLMTGFWNYERFLQGKVNSIKKGTLKGELYHLPQGYPALIDGKDAIKGEVMEVDDETLRNLDDLEGYYGEGKNNLYNRKEGYVQVEEENILCWIYFYNRVDYALKNGTRISNGDWRKFMRIGEGIND